MRIASILSFALLEGYGLDAALLLGSFAFFPTHRPAIKRLLISANKLLLGGAVLLLLLTGRELSQLLALKDEAAYYAQVNRMTGPYWFFYWTSLLWKGLLPQIFWWAKLRRSLVATAAIAAILLVDFFAPILLPFNPDYLPSSWAMQPNYIGLLVSTGLFMAMLATIYGLVQWRTVAAGRR